MKTTTVGFLLLGISGVLSFSSRRTVIFNKPVQSSLSISERRVRHLFNALSDKNSVVSRIPPGKSWPGKFSSSLKKLSDLVASSVSRFFEFLWLLLFKTKATRKTRHQAQTTTVLPPPLTIESYTKPPSLSAPKIELTETAKAEKLLFLKEKRNTVGLVLERSGSPLESTKVEAAKENEANKSSNIESVIESPTPSKESSMVVEAVFSSMEIAIANQTEDPQLDVDVELSPEGKFEPSADASIRTPELEDQHISSLLDDLQTGIPRDIQALTPASLAAIKVEDLCQDQTQVVADSAREYRWQLAVGVLVTFMSTAIAVSNHIGAVSDHIGLVS